SQVLPGPRPEHPHVPPHAGARAAAGEGTRARLGGGQCPAREIAETRSQAQARAESEFALSGGV
ncbi:unnamed protein product, partial [Effrenium voratum]